MVIIEQHRASRAVPTSNLVVVVVVVVGVDTCNLVILAILDDMWASVGIVDSMIVGVVV